MAARDLDRGTWYAKVTDSNGCYAGASFRVQGPAPLRVSATAGYDSCHSPTAGLIKVSASGGTLPYSYGRVTAGERILQFDSLLTGLPAGLHEVVATDAMGCTSHPYPVAVTLPATFELDAGADQHISWGKSVVLDATLSGVDVSEGALQWSSTAAFSPLLHTYDPPLRIKTTPPRSADYVVTFTSAEHCVRSDTVSVVVDTTARLYAPTAFSPNGDGNNDRFSFYTTAVVTGTVALSIYDRWGNLVWKQPAEGVAEWDGTFNGIPVNSGVYVYSGSVRRRGGGTLPVQGSVLLLR